MREGVKTFKNFPVERINTYQGGLKKGEKSKDFQKFSCTETHNLTSHLRNISFYNWTHNWQKGFVKKRTKVSRTRKLILLIH